MSKTGKKKKNKISYIAQVENQPWERTSKNKAYAQQDRKTKKMYLNICN